MANTPLSLLPSPPQVILVGPSLEETLQEASTKLGKEVVELQTIRGATIDDVSLLRLKAHQLCTVYTGF